MFERLSGDFNRGYTKAIQDVQAIFEYIQYDLAHHHKKLTPKLMVDLLKCILENRERVRESQDGFIRYSSKAKDFEFYEPREEG